MHETELYKPIYDYLVQQGYTVHSEVKNCDVTAVKGDELIIVEMKTSFNLRLLMQAVKRQRAADSVYVAVPRPKGRTDGTGRSDMLLLLRRLELGLIYVNADPVKPDIEIVLHPEPFDRQKSSRYGKRVRNSIIREVSARHGDYNTGGSSRRKLMTSYRENAVHIACCLDKHGRLSAAQLKKLGTGPKTYSILTKNFYGWFERVDKGLYCLSPQARGILVEYKDIVRHYNSVLTNDTTGFKL